MREMNSQAGHDGEVVLARLRDALGVLRKRKWTIALVNLAVIAGAVLYTREQVPIYRASAALIIERTPPRVLSGVKEVIELGSSNYWAIKDYLRTQYEIIHSREVAERVVDRLALRDDRRFASAAAPGPGALDGVPSGKVGLEGGPDPVDLVLSKVRVEPLPDSMMVFVHAEDADPEFAMDLANEVAEAYRDHNLEMKKRIVTEAQKDLDKMVERLRAEKDRAEAEVVRFEQEHNIGSFENQKRMIDGRIGDYTGKLNEVGLRLIALRARLKQLGEYRTGRRAFSVAYGKVIENPLVLSMKQRHSELEDRLAELTVTYLDKHPKVDAVRRQISRLEREIRREVSNIVRAVETEYEEVRDTEAGIREQLEEAKLAERELNRIKASYQPLVHRRDEAAKFYADVLYRQEETTLSAQSTMNNVRIHDLAVRPADPVRPNWRLAAAVAVLLGFLGGVAVAFLRELLDTTVKTRDDIEEVAQLSYLGAIPPLGAEEGRGRRYGGYAPRGEDPAEKVEIEHPALFIHYRRTSVAAERTHNVRTNLVFMMPERPLRAVLVTSPNPEEGKTTVSTNVAISMAQGGSRTVLVDADLRRPRVHSCFGVGNDVGLTSAVIGSEPVGAYVQPSVVPNLDLLPCGPVPPDPTALLHTARFRDLMDQLRAEYDVVIVDSPPVLPVTDALIIANHVDGVVLVAKSGKTVKDALLAARQQLLQVNAEILGAVLNDHVIARRGAGHYKYYRHRYSYADSNETPGRSS